MKSLLRLLLALAATAVAAFAQTGTAIPGGNQSTTYVITKPGRYYLAAHRVMTDPNKNAIEIASDDVTLDLNGHTVAFATSTGTGHGIYGKDLHNIEIHRGSVVSTPQDGIHIASETVTSPDSTIIRILDIRISQTGKSGLNINAWGIRVSRCNIDQPGDRGITLSGDSALVDECQVVGSGREGILGYLQKLSVKNCVVTNTSLSGISCLEYGSIENCEISLCNLSAAADHGGIYLGNYSTARGNSLFGCEINGIIVGTFSQRVLIEGNSIIGSYKAIESQSMTSNAGLMINNRCTGTITNKLINGGGNIVF